MAPWLKEIIIKKRKAYVEKTIERAKKAGSDHIEMDLPFSEKTLAEKILFFFFISPRKKKISFEEYRKKAETIGEKI